MDLELPRQLDQSAIAKKPVVLAVDDDADNLLVMTYVLELLDCLFITAGDGQTALSLAQTHQPKLILLDIILPSLNGLEVIARLKQVPQTRGIPIIAVTSLVSIADREEILRAGCSDYISKPYVLEDLEAIIRRYLSLPPPQS
jgi:CheY-like chemotaxis protein